MAEKTLSETFIRDVENGLVALLAPLVDAGFEVGYLPEEKTGIDAAILPKKPRLWASYRESTVDKEMDYLTGVGNNLAQCEILHFDVVILARGRRTDTGTYLVMNAARSLLIGQEPAPGATALKFTGQRLEEFEEAGVWRYSVSFTTDTYIVADVLSEETGPAITALIGKWLQESE